MSIVVREGKFYYRKPDRYPDEASNERDAIVSWLRVEHLKQKLDSVQYYNSLDEIAEMIERKEYLK